MFYEARMITRFIVSTIEKAGNHGNTSHRNWLQ